MTSISAVSFKNHTESQPQSKNTPQLPTVIPKTEAKEFNNPIYAGLQCVEDNKEFSMWGPWILPTDSAPIQKSHSLNNQKKLKITNNQWRKSPDLSVPKPPPKNTRPNPSVPLQKLPNVREKNLESLKQIRYSSLQLNPKKVKVMEKPPQVKKVKVQSDKKRQKFDEQIREQYVKKGKALGDIGRQFKMNTVMYNYCTHSNIERDLLYYRRKERELKKENDERREGEKFIKKMRNINLY